MGQGICSMVLNAPRRKQMCFRFLSSPNVCSGLAASWGIPKSLHSRIHMGTNQHRRHPRLGGDPGKGHIRIGASYPQQSYLGPAHRAPRLRAVSMVTARPASSSSPLSSPSRPSPRLAPLRGEGGGAGGGDRMQAKRKSAARRPLLIGWRVPEREAPPPRRGSRDPFQRWPPCCFDE